MSSTAEVAPARHPAGRAALLAGLAALAAAGVALVYGQGSAQPPAERVVVLGIDGMDYELTRKLMDEGQLPNLSRLAADGHFQSLGTSVPPLSPVAWSDFITAMDGGGHGIFDFIHRDPANLRPYLSTSEPRERPRRFLGIAIPFLKTTEMTLLRQGRSFWEVLEDGGIETTIVRMPANFPVTGTASRELSGMGTPDVLGTYGTFSFYTSKLFAFAGKDISGGEVIEVDAFSNVVESSLLGPKVGDEVVKVDFTAYLDPVEQAARFVVGSHEFILQQGEWSDWLRVEFPISFLDSIPGICRFFLRSVRPEFELYVSPINIDPLEPFMAISTPESFAGELAASTSGGFYTQGMPEDTKALDEGIFNRDEFLRQATMSNEEIAAQLPGVLAGFNRRGGLLFYYFGDIDQVSHMMWRTLDPEHPAYDVAKDEPYKDVIPGLYRRMDKVVGEVMAAIPAGTRLFVMSDHGFTSWRRSFHLNTWLHQNGYLAVKDPKRLAAGIANIDWSQTRAYGVGFNGLYVNLRGREKSGIVDPAESEALVAELKEKLLAVVDPATSQPAITKMYVVGEEFMRGDGLEIGPDLIVGYAKGTRASDDSALGEVTTELFADNTREWSGDHGMDHETVPGILFVNAPLRRPVTRLENLAPAIVAEFGIDWQPEGAEPVAAP